LDADLLAPVLEFLRANLPDYMIPSGWVVLGKLPLTSNGKLDRRALPPPQAGLSSRADGMLPRNAREQALLGIWQEILGVSSLGVDENFFELGGDSLHGVRLITKVEEQLKVRLQVIAVFQYPTIMQMAEAIEAQQSTSGSQSDDLAAIFDEGSL
jgi:acyl carrier protein